MFNEYEHINKMKRYGFAFIGIYGYKKYPTIGRKSSKNDTNKNGSKFWGRRDEIVQLFELGDSELIEHCLGLENGSLSDNEIECIVDYLYEKHNYRCANGFEVGINRYFTGYDNYGKMDMSLYIGKTCGFCDEAVSDRFDASEARNVGKKKVTNNKLRMRRLEYSYAAKDRDYFDKEKKDIKGNLNDVIEYLNYKIYRLKRDTEYYKNVGGPIQETRINDELKWCEDYIKKLIKINDKLDKYVL